MQVFSGIRSAERVVHGTVGGCDGRSLLEVTGHFCAIVGLARSVRMVPLLGIGGGVFWFCFSWIFVMIGLIWFYDLAHLFWHLLDSVIACFVLILMRGNIYTKYMFLNSVWLCF